MSRRRSPRWPRTAPRAGSLPPPPPLPEPLPEPLPAPLPPPADVAARPPADLFEEVDDVEERLRVFVDEATAPPRSGRRGGDSLTARKRLELQPWRAAPTQALSARPGGCAGRSRTLRLRHRKLRSRNRWTSGLRPGRRHRRAEGSAV